MSKINLNEIVVIDELDELEDVEKISEVKKTKMKPEDAKWRNKKQGKGRYKARRNRATAIAESESSEK
jgi:CRISPR/Cas system-associated protein Cas5 (RAMP superfamily)